AVTCLGLCITGVVGDYSMTSSSTPLTAVSSVTLTPGSAHAPYPSLFRSPSASAQSGIVFVQQPVIQQRDSSGNAVSESDIEITAAGSAGSTLIGTGTVDTDEDGVATFTGLGISGVVGDYTITFSSTPLIA